MSKQLLIMRHGEAIPLSFGSNDFERVLSEKGTNEAIKAGQYLLNNEIQVDQILHSMAARTTMTAHLVAQVNRIDHAEIQAREDFYQSSVGGLLNSINLFDNHWDTVMIVAHNPTLSYLIEYLSGNQYNFLATANIEAITFEFDSWMEVAQYAGKSSWSYKGAQ